MTKMIGCGALALALWTALSFFVGFWIESERIVAGACFDAFLTLLVLAIFVLALLDDYQTRKAKRRRRPFRGFGRRSPDPPDDSAGPDDEAGVPAVPSNPAPTLVAAAKKEPEDE